jgi:hypothetical protein
MSLPISYPIESIVGICLHSTRIGPFLTGVEFLKTKDQAVQRIKNYMAYLRVQDKTPLAICADCGTEFVKVSLMSWCHSQGIELQVTAPYSPSQNGIAEYMNHTLGKLAHTMLIAGQLLEFLWEPTVADVAYLQNLLYMKPLAKKTPYQIWHGCKPNVLNLCEFRAPMWVLLQGQKV